MLEDQGVNDPWILIS